MSENNGHSNGNGKHNGKPGNIGPKKPRKKRADPLWYRPFFAALECGASIRSACKTAKITRSTVYERIDKQPEFRTKIEEAQAQVPAMLEEEAIKRAMGVSDTLLIFLLKGAMPEKYRERREVHHKGQVAHKHEHITAKLEELGDDDLRAIQRLRKLDLVESEN